MIVERKPEFELDVNRYCKRIKIDGDSFSDQSAREMIPELMEIAKEKADIKTLYLVGEEAIATGIEEVDGCETKVVCLCYASREILQIISKMMEDGDFLEAYMLNDLVNDVLFNASNQMNEEIFNRMKGEGKFLTESYSPGEGGVSLELQKDLLEFIKREIPLDVHINESYMLIPEKSMMYVYGADSKNKEISVKHDCKKCSNVDCFFRVEE